MKAFVTGGTGFIGERLVKALRARGDDVVCLVRRPEKAAALEALGCEIVEGGLSDDAAIERGVMGADAVFHVAADYRIGIKAEKHASMQASNIGGTTTVIDAAHAAGVKRIVYVSTIAVFGNTHGEIVDEAYEHPAEKFGSEYERTKYEAHKIAKERAANGAPVVIVQPGGVYGPGDKSSTGTILKQAAQGKLPAVSFPDLGFNMVHVDDVVDGILLAHDKGRVGESYVLGGEITTMRKAVDKAAAAAGRKPPRLNLPTPLIKAMVPLAPIVTKAMGLGPNMRELISTSDGVTYWASDAKAREELGYAPRDMDAGMPETVAG